MEPERDRLVFRMFLKSLVPCLVLAASVPTWHLTGSFKRKLVFQNPPPAPPAAVLVGAIAQPCEAIWKWFAACWQLALIPRKSAIPGSRRYTRRPDMATLRPWPDFTYCFAPLIRLGLLQYLPGSQETSPEKGSPFCDFALFWGPFVLH